MHNLATVSAADMEPYRNERLILRRQAQGQAFAARLIYLAEKPKSKIPNAARTPFAMIIEDAGDPPTNFGMEQISDLFAIEREDGEIIIEATGNIIINTIGADASRAAFQFLFN